MFKNGFIAIHRKMAEWEWYHDTNVVRVFLHCLIKANWKEKNWQGNIIPRGTFITSYQHLADETSLSVRNVRTALKKLKTTSEVTIKTTNKFTMISITNYNEYQDIDKQSDKQTTIKRQSNDKQTTTTEPYNQDNKGNNKSIGVKKTPKSTRFKKPGINEIQRYIDECNLTSVNADDFYNFYDSKNWMVGKNKMQNWKAAISGWHSRNMKTKPEVKNEKRTMSAVEQVEFATRHRD